MPIRVTAGSQEPLYDRLSACSGRERRLCLKQILIDPEALARLPRLAGARPGAEVVVVQDETVMRRGGQSVKPVVAELLRQAGAAVEVVTLRDDHELHTTADQIAVVRSHLAAGQTVVSCGSGTITDITKHAVHGFETNNPGRPLTLVAVQTANSVVAYTSNQAVVTTDGVKRTVPSRLPDTLVLDTHLLADCPSALNQGGIGDTFVVASSFADYRLVHLLGLGRWEPLSWNLVEGPLRDFLSRSPTLSDRGPVGMGEVGLDLAACGLALSLADESAPVSGLEHVTSHTLDMAAPRDGRPVGNHGSQCGIATIFTLVAFNKLLAVPRLEPIDLTDIDLSVEREKVRRAFGDLDAEGRAWRECWSDFAAKIEAWRGASSQVDSFVRHWPRHRDDLRRYATDPEAYVAGLAATGHPLRFEEISTGLSEERARWAFTNSRLMRKRTSVADLIGFSGWWSSDFIDDVFADYRTLVARHSPPVPAPKPPDETESPPDHPTT